MTIAAQATTGLEMLGIGSSLRAYSGLSWPVFCPKNALNFSKLWEGCRD